MVPFFFVLYQFFRRLAALLKDPNFRGTLLFVFITLLIGALFYHKAEGWSWLDSFYFTVVTLTTIGYGDLAPKTPAGKIFTMFYILLGLGVLAVFISTVAEHTMKEQRAMAKNIGAKAAGFGWSWKSQQTDQAEALEKEQETGNQAEPPERD